MRSEKDMMDLILRVAKEDERIRAVLLTGSRADSQAQRDGYQDYDIVYYVEDVAPFFPKCGLGGSSFWPSGCDADARVHDPPSAAPRR